MIKFRRNCGQTAAMAAGIEHAARRDHLVTMDADLQNDPADIPRLLAKIARGLRPGRRLAPSSARTSCSRARLPSVLANRLIAWVTGVDIKDNGCSLKAYRADRDQAGAALRRDAPLHPGDELARRRARSPRSRSITAPASFGRSKYGLSRIYKVLADLIAIKTLLLFAARPLFCFVGSAAVAGALSLLCALVAIYHAHGERRHPRSWCS